MQNGFTLKVVGTKKDVAFQLSFEQTLPEV